MDPSPVRPEDPLRVRPGKRLKAQLRAELAVFVKAKEGRLSHPLLKIWASQKRLGPIGLGLQDPDVDLLDALDFIEAVYLGLSRKK